MALARITNTTFKANATDPMIEAAAVTPDDANDLTFATRGINVAVAGNVKIDTLKGNTVTLFLSAGPVHLVSACRIYATGTTATGITALR